MHITCRRGVSAPILLVRDTSGSFIPASYSYISHVLDATMAEASALRDVLDNIVTYALYGNKPTEIMES